MLTVCYAIPRLSDPLSEGSLRQACPLGYVGFALVLRDRCFLNISLELRVNNTTVIIFIGLIPKGKLREGRKFPFFFFFCRKSEIERWLRQNFCRHSTMWRRARLCTWTNKGWGYYILNDYTLAWTLDKRAGLSGWVLNIELEEQRFKYLIKMVTENTLHRILDFRQ